MVCKICGTEMILDDVDTHSPGNKDKYYVCSKCDVGCVEKIRNSKSIKVEWQEEN